MCEELEISENEISILEPEQSSIFWEKTTNLEVFSRLQKNLIRIVVPASETFEVINMLKSFKVKYFIDWGGGLIWVQLDNISSKILKDAKDIVHKSKGYLTNSQIVLIDEMQSAGKFDEKTALLNKLKRIITEDKINTCL